MKPVVYINPVNGSNNLSSASVASGFTVTGGLLAAGQLGLLTIKDGASTVTKVVQADSHGSFSQAFKSLDTASFHADTMSVQVQAISSMIGAAQLNTHIKTHAASMLYKVLGVASEQVSVSNNKVIIDANSENYSDQTTLTPLKGMAYEVNHFNSEDYTPNGFTHRDQGLNVNVGGSTVDVYVNQAQSEIDIYIGGQSSYGHGAPSVVIKGDLADVVDGDNITLVGLTGQYSIGDGGNLQGVTLHGFNNVS